ncbi:hypothetical protein RUMHYD_01680 [Blautia hydrogenotrophica DSM 10507]|uniref:Uncharacterized protein n=1 Tax=Blautia hydrogenotrophica (strain DSM 10507 / JCM 14656 / S5a33) TaxID=476272 RepID=C0CLF9_BLAHS|nr:hypothetical protein RUMHYD_01680 [Blautia hydrogenotrophica DSM 10507]
MFLCEDRFVAKPMFLCYDILVNGKLFAVSKFNSILYVAILLQCLPRSRRRSRKRSYRIVGCCLGCCR